MKYDYKAFSSEYGMRTMSIQEIMVTVISDVIIIVQKNRNTCFILNSKSWKKLQGIYLSLSLFQGKTCTYQFRISFWVSLGMNIKILLSGLLWQHKQCCLIVVVRRVVSPMTGFWSSNCQQLTASRNNVLIKDHCTKGVSLTRKGGGCENYIRGGKRAKGWGEQKGSPFA